MAQSRRVEERRLAALGTRRAAARIAAGRPHPEHLNNDDETNYPAQPFIGNFSKSLVHDPVTGDPDPYSYGTLLRAIQSGDPEDYREVVRSPSAAIALVNPQGGLAFELEGPDAQAVTMPPAPRFDSAQAAGEAGELYWMALARDVHFAAYGSDAVVAQAVTSLNTEFPAHREPAMGVTTQNVFRGIFPGEEVGPYVSQFLWKGNSDPRKAPGQGQSAADGFITYGSQVIDQRHLTVAAGSDFLTTFSDWLDAQNGVDTRGNDVIDPTRRFIRNLRDGANFVHFDLVLNAFYNAAHILLSEPEGNQLVGTGRPLVDAEFPFGPGNPYLGDAVQAGFVTFGPIHALQLVSEIIGRAGRAVWFQKWNVHRRLRPEEYGGRVDNHIAGRNSYPLDASILDSLQTGLLSAHFPVGGTYLLPMAYPEGAPLHPAYGAGHATMAGACATVLKAFFDESVAIENPLIPDAAGTSLLPYTGPGAGDMKVGGELNKLAGNIAIFRNAAGVHWRTDYDRSLLLGEDVAIGILQEMSILFNEDMDLFQFTSFEGDCVRIRDGFVDRCPA